MQHVNSGSRFSGGKNMLALGLLNKIKMKSFAPKISQDNSKMKTASNFNVKGLFESFKSQNVQNTNEKPPKSPKSPKIAESMVNDYFEDLSGLNFFMRLRKERNEKEHLIQERVKTAGNRYLKSFPIQSSYCYQI